MKDLPTAQARFTWGWSFWVVLLPQHMVVSKEGDRMMLLEVVLEAESNLNTPTLPLESIMTQVEVEKPCLQLCLCFIFRDRFSVIHNSSSQRQKSIFLCVYVCLRIQSPHQVSIKVTKEPNSLKTKKEKDNTSSWKLLWVSLAECKPRSRMEVINKNKQSGWDPVLHIVVSIVHQPLFLSPPLSFASSPRLLLGPDGSNYSKAWKVVLRRSRTDNLSSCPSPVPLLVIFL